MNDVAVDATTSRHDSSESLPLFSILGPVAFLQAVESKYFPTLTFVGK